MIKLTAAKACERIEHLQTWQAQRGLTLREEEYLQALEIAARVLGMVDMDRENCPYADIYGGSVESFINGANYVLTEMKHG